MSLNIHYRVREPNHLSNSHRYTVECVLPNNLLFEQLFTFLFFWYTMILILNLISLLTWSHSFIRPVRIKYVTTRLKLILIRHLRKTSLTNDNHSDQSQKQLSKDSLLHRDESHTDFAQNYLKCDGIFVLRLLETNTSDFVVTQVIEELFYSYEKKALQPVVLDGLAKMMSTLGPDQGLLSLGKLLFLPVMSDPKIAASFGTTTGNSGLAIAPDDSNKMLLPSLTMTTDEPLRNTPKLLVPPTPPHRRSLLTSITQQRTPTDSSIERMNTTRQTPFSSISSPRTRLSVDEITGILRERRQQMKSKKR